MTLIITYSQRNTCVRILPKVEIFGKEVEVKRYLLWVSDVGTINFVKFRSETHGLNEELGI